jgi:hypothetical protein
VCDHAKVDGRCVKHLRDRDCGYRSDSAQGRDTDGTGNGQSKDKDRTRTRTGHGQDRTGIIRYCEGIALHVRGKGGRGRGRGTGSAGENTFVVISLGVPVRGIKMQCVHRGFEHHFC